MSNYLNNISESKIFLIKFLRKHFRNVSKIRKYSFVAPKMIIMHDLGKNHIIICGIFIKMFHFLKYCIKVLESKSCHSHSSEAWIILKMAGYMSGSISRWNLNLTDYLTKACWPKIVNLSDVSPILRFFLYTVFLSSAFPSFP